ncbi:unnamed protein product [Phytophthora lilii]|uniref:Unnamed protein product n=1 Tax=Phytophthora lilii TaxID=2077276 RepID=A0A9W6TKE9_9STRA|nr:unnamed protein product [Phytophthora lilii]
MRFSFIFVLLAATFVAICGCIASAEDILPVNAHGTRAPIPEDNREGNEPADPEDEERNAFTNKLETIMQKVRFTKVKAFCGKLISSQLKTWNGEPINIKDLKAQLSKKPDPARVKEALQSPELKNVKPPAHKGDLPTAADVTAMRSFSAKNSEDANNILLWVYDLEWVLIALFGFTVLPVVAFIYSHTEYMVTHGNWRQLTISEHRKQ